MFYPYKQSLKNLGIPTSMRHQKQHFLNMFMYVIYKYTINGKMGRGQENKISQ